MKVDAGGYATTVDGAGDSAREAEQAGYDGYWIAETQLDPFIAQALAAERTNTVELGTAIAVAFARTPMTVAMQANDLQLASGGRFALGLGSQIKPHITKRFSMPWSKPAARMREFILAVRAIWDSWETGDKLDFQGEFYTHTLMTPFFNPGPNPHGRPKIYLAGVGELMTEVAGEVADGFLCHGFSTERYLREVTLPALERGRAKAGKTMDDFEIAGPPFVVSGLTDEDIDGASQLVKNQIGFYGSTPAYRKVLELHGWGEVGDRLNSLTKQGKWGEIGDLIDDEMLNTFAVVGKPEEAVAEIKRRYGDVISRITFPVAHQSDPDRWRAAFDQLRAP